MDTRVIKYFLTVAQTNNITRAAQRLHITQPTLSRQIIELEKELGVTLFDRQQRQMALTNEGALFQQRASTILSLVNQTKQELQNTEKELTGVINIGCVVSNVSKLIMKIISNFQKKYPNVKFNLYDGNGDLLRQRLDSRLDDFAVLIEPVEAAKYNFIVLPVHERWGLIVKSSDPLAKKKTITKDDLYKLPLIVPTRNIVRDEISDVLKLDQTKLNVMATNNLPSNAYKLLKTGNYYLLGIEGIVDSFHDPELTFIPFSPHKETGHVLAWRKNTVITPVMEKFLQEFATLAEDQ
ncbi:LysR family transcriptional regulator [Limosilactobacillus fastidiosus]|uniref:LysR family transcriptional regulator n=1 Tax=Limosilactobacillus fastidiosus TaxID=2759855 RepID=A0A7W3YCQ5_9LACO|nr:LysR family transcriptional regulator [Limosilactobacillus fastidiosus]MBB1062712.1 LysR family transcriptional regulator [Limosilactobacillus fastidiosus]MBB1086553.1 LysR family transcriptional regulator [Limosilactobacillus fastidiosus]MCD7084875.1 LysR family transcriptional regulator [Limosilactobacillus fastidiosus]MCD7085304.1 LysR family transcriptional regulator [Limosilactobacillus fastidiosus]MCD7115141.1 LysR family transcriptional regulator [Limosilactobacillus fastidiosus]